MLNLFCRFWHNIQYPLTAGLLSFMMAFPVYGENCNTSPVFNFTRAIYLNQYALAQSLLPEISEQRSLELAMFLKQVTVWKRAYDQQDKKAQEMALNAIDKQIAQFDAALSHGPANIIKTTLGNIMFHAARMNLVSGRVLRSARLAKRANQWLTEAYQAEPENTDTYLALGLFQYYAGNDEDNFGWIKRMLSIKGNKAQGRLLIEKALKNSPDYAFEAARSLVMDLAWEKPNICLYPSLITSTDDSAPFAVRKQEITIRLFCGQIKHAQTELAAIDKSALNEEQAVWAYEARLYALSDLGKIAQIQEILKESSDENDANNQRAVALFSLAKAFDSNGEHKQAQKLYDKIARSDLMPNYKKLAKAYKADLSGYSKRVEHRPSSSGSLICGSE